jgi:hypothetical protein
MPREEGYEPNAPELNEDEGVMDIFHAANCTLVEESKMVAETIVLRCNLCPIPLLNRNIHVQLIAEGETLESAPLYDQNSIAYGYNWDQQESCWQGIGLGYAGIGRGVREGTSFDIQGNTLPFGKLEIPSPLYIKPFAVEQSNYQESLTSLPSGRVLRSPPGVLDTQVFRGYGGYYKPGITLEEIQQIYYHLTSTHDRTRVRLMSSDMLSNQHTPPPHGGRAFDYAVKFIPLLEEEWLSLPGALAKGYAKLSIISDLGTSVFSSYRCEPVSGVPSTVDIHFRP